MKIMKYGLNNIRRIDFTGKGMYNLLKMIGFDNLNQEKMFYFRYNKDKLNGKRCYDVRLEQEYSADCG